MQSNPLLKNIFRGWLRTALLILGLLAGVSPLSATEAVDLRELMDDDVFRSAGLHRLSPQELAVLNAWIQNHFEEQAETGEQGVARGQPGGVEAFGREHLPDDARGGSVPDEIRGRIVGDFRGWSGNTTFRLENGQVWRQAEAGRFFVRAENPVVVIRRGALGSYLLSVEGYGSTVRVRRVD